MPQSSDGSRPISNLHKFWDAISAETKPGKLARSNLWKQQIKRLIRSRGLDSGKVQPQLKGIRLLVPSQEARSSLVSLDGNGVKRCQTHVEVCTGGDRVRSDGVVLGCGDVLGLRQMSN